MRRVPTSIAVLGLWVSLATAPLAAFGTLLVPNGNPTGGPTVCGPSGCSTLDPSPAVYMASSASTWLLPALSAQGINAANGWTINTGLTLEGTITLETYRPWVENFPAVNCGSFTDVVTPNAGAGGADICLTYQPQGEDPSGSIVRWLQVISTNDPSGFGTTNGYNQGGGYTGYIDNGWTGQTNPPSDPYYGKDDDINSTGYWGNSTAFVDQPARGFQQGLDWDAQVFIAFGDLNAKYLNIYDGVAWGFTLTPEPGTASLIAFGTVLIAIGRRARR
jgi:hypothetical protein